MFSFLITVFVTCIGLIASEPAIRTVTKLERDMFIVRSFNYCDNLLKTLAYSQLFNAEIFLGDPVSKTYMESVDSISSRVALHKTVARYLKPFKTDLREKLLVETSNTDLYKNQVKFDVCTQLSNGIVDFEKMYQLAIAFDIIVFSDGDLQCVEWKKCVAWQKANAKIYLGFFINLAMFSKKLEIAVVESMNETPKGARLIDMQNLIEKHIKN